ncbi:hypothetical protein QQ020_24875 [Fulvivirgaceae bacterium BMA12]|uniref:YxeA family protein n=1 Tax=Agaribacillus aureus TaxID=3051825 RepID=A0ABT8LC26_9BACT|nr:hypothetical protein [Fulvivirgaceae bacterium BMA12]
MKSINVITERLIVIVGIIMAILILLVFNTKAASIDKPEKDLRFKSEVLKIEKTATNYEWQKEQRLTGNEDKKVFKFFDKEENLMYQLEIHTDKIAGNKKLLAYLHQSDLIMNLDNTSFYRLSK